MKQLLRILLLKANKAIVLVDVVGNVPHEILGRIRKKLLPVQGGKVTSKIFITFIHASLVMALAGFVCEAVAHLKGWNDPMDLHFSRTDRAELETTGWLRSAYSSWSELLALYVAPIVKVPRSLYVALFLIQAADRLLQCFACLWIKYKKLKPRISADAFNSEYLGVRGDNYPMVLVQIPMCNEREVYENSISAVCELDWPKDRFLVQVLDDSDDESIQRLINREVANWREKGVNITYRHRLVRTGYKAGNLKSAMSCDYVKDYEFVAIFDADFRPSPDFLRRTVPHFKDNPDLGLVQARWTFVNKNGNLLTRMQSINMCFHFEVEQQVNGTLLNFFGFNGTAGVWRMEALEDSGGWLERTTVEDMDIAVRAHLNGWKFIFLNEVKVLCELPESYEEYRKQQHRWHSGPIHLLRLCLPNIMASQISILKKANLVFLFFLLRKLILPIYNFTFLCVMLPLTIFVPEAHLPAWLICYVPLLLSTFNIILDPRSTSYILPYLLFENTMSLTKSDAVISGLLSLGSSHEWIVTKKKGRRWGDNECVVKEEGGREMKRTLGMEKGEAAPKRRKEKEKKKKIGYEEEFGAGLLLLTAAARSLLSARLIHCCVLSLQGISFLVVGLGMIGEDDA